MMCFVGHMVVHAAVRMIEFVKFRPPFGRELPRSGAAPEFLVRVVRGARVVREFVTKVAREPRERQSDVEHENEKRRGTLDQHGDELAGQQSLRCRRAAEFGDAH